MGRCDFALQGFQELPHGRRKTPYDQVDRFPRGIDDPPKADFFLGKNAFFHHESPPFLEAIPELPAHQDQRERPNLLTLNKCGSLEEFVKRPEAVTEPRMDADNREWTPITANNSGLNTKVPKYWEYR